jgi:hypothetical protein
VNQAKSQNMNPVDIGNDVKVNIPEENPTILSDDNTKKLPVVRRFRRSRQVQTRQESIEKKKRDLEKESLSDEKSSDTSVDTKNPPMEGSESSNALITVSSSSTARGKGTLVPEFKRTPSSARQRLNTYKIVHDVD